MAILIYCVCTIPDCMASSDTTTTKVMGVKYLTLERISGNDSSSPTIDVPDILLNCYRDPLGYAAFVNGLVVCDLKQDTTVLVPNQERTAQALRGLIGASPPVMGKPPLSFDDYSSDRCTLFSKVDETHTLAYREWDVSDGVVPCPERSFLLGNHVAACYLGMNVGCLNMLTGDGTISKYKPVGYKSIGRHGSLYQKLHYFEAFLLAELNGIKPRLHITGKGRAMNVTIG